MFMFFSSLSFSTFLIWIIIAAITKKQKRIPTIGLMVSTIILITGISISTSASAYSTNVTKLNITSAEISNHRISKEMGLNIVIAKVKIDAGLHILYDSERVINEKKYYLYTLNTDEYTLEDFSYCVNVDTGEVFKCSINIVLSPIE